MSASPCRPLEGLKVLELAQVMAGPVAGLMLADLGAEVVKIEKVKGGDDARAFTSAKKNDSPASFQMLNRGKESVALDLKSNRGRETFERIVRQADVVLENFRPGTLEAMGLGAQRLAQLNPRLIHCSITGYGAKGPLSERGGFDLILQAFSGLVSVTGEPGRMPVKPGISVADVNAGVLAALGVVSAYIHVLRTGRGQHVQTSLLQASIQQLYWHAALFFSTGAMSPRLGTAHPIIAPYQVFRCRDGGLAIGGANEANWVRITDVLGHPEWRDDARFRHAKGRLEHREALTECMDSVLMTEDKAYWEERLIGAGVPVGAVQSVGEALSHPQTEAVDMVIDSLSSQGLPCKSLGLPIHFDGRNDPARAAAPWLGEHTVLALERWGFTSEEIRQLLDAGVALQHPSSSEKRSIAS
jgi:crotonobetainyl-CoA:carnitine CoA-transferase CaiB-like acyl-CoA transferase